MLRVVKVLFFFLLASSIAIFGTAAWLDETKQDWTVNLVEGSPQHYPQVCPLHSVEMKWDRVPIIYGLLINSPNDLKNYPHSNKWVGGGCLGGGEPRYALIRYCPECRNIEKGMSKVLADEGK